MLLLQDAHYRACQSPVAQLCEIKHLFSPREIDEDAARHVLRGRRGVARHGYVSIIPGNIRDYPRALEATSMLVSRLAR